MNNWSPFSREKRSLRFTKKRILSRFAFFTSILKGKYIGCTFSGDEKRSLKRIGKTLRKKGWLRVKKWAQKAGSLKSSFWGTPKDRRDPLFMTKVLFQKLPLGVRTFRVSIFFWFSFGLFWFFVGLLFLYWHFGPSQLSTVTANSDQLS